MNCEAPIGSAMVANASSGGVLAAGRDPPRDAPREPGAQQERQRRRQRAQGLRPNAAVLAAIAQ